MTLPRALVAIAMAIVAVIHLMPLAGIAGKAMLATLYGITPGDDATTLLLRHRALLFGLVGAFAFAAIFREAWRTPALVAGWVSVVGFLLLAMPPEALNAPLRRVFAVDVVALVALVVATALHVRAERGGG